MRIISFSTEETEWKSPRMGIILAVNGHDTGYRLDCEKLFDKADGRQIRLRGSTWMDHGSKKHARLTKSL